MPTVGVRELRQRASDVLRRVENGETFEVTDRGRPVARIVPIVELNALERMRRAGETTPATEDMSTLPPPLPLKPGQEPPSRVLERLRRNER